MSVTHSWFGAGPGERPGSTYHWRCCPASVRFHCGRGSSRQTGAMHQQLDRAVSNEDAPTQGQLGVDPPPALGP